MIDQYITGSHMTVDGRRYTRDLKIIDGRVTSNWWRQSGHRLSSGDIADILSAGPEILVIGTGYAGAMRVPGDVHRLLKERNIRLVAEQTRSASETYNRLLADGSRVAGAFHLTC